MPDNLNFLKTPSVHGIVTHLSQHLDEIQDIYIVIRKTNRQWETMCTVGTEGVAFASTLLHAEALQQMRSTELDLRD